MGTLSKRHSKTVRQKVRKNYKCLGISSSCKIINESSVTFLLLKKFTKIIPKKQLTWLSCSEDITQNQNNSPQNNNAAANSNYQRTIEYLIPFFQQLRGITENSESEKNEINFEGNLHLSQTHWKPLSSKDNFDGQMLDMPLGLYIAESAPT